VNSARSTPSTPAADADERLRAAIKIRDIAILDPVLDRVKLAVDLLALAWGALGRAAPEALLPATFIGSTGSFLLRPVYYLQSFRRTHGTWPWRVL
jgi:hypothetical protein